MTRRTSQFAAGLSILLLLTVRQAQAYGPEGHGMVGAVADDRLAGTPGGQQVSALLDGLTLQRVATIPDEIKGWDRGAGPDGAGGFHLPDHPEIEKQLAAFWRANQMPNPPADENLADTPSHHWFHYTDVPVADGELYETGTAGRSKWDIVHMTDFCIRVLQGKESDQNARAITKPIAVILLAHYLGDIHQPLHVGAEYFDKSGHIANPDKVADSLGDQGGNTFNLVVKGTTATGRKTTLHGFWDTPAALAALEVIKKQIQATQKLAIGQAPPEIGRPEIAKFLASTPPKGWEIPANVPLDQVGKYLANDILPLAREAHDRLNFENLQPRDEHGTTLETGFAHEKQMPDGISYVDWAGSVVATELAKGGWRLAYILDKALTGVAPTAAASATPASNDLSPAPAVADSAAPSATPGPQSTPVATPAP